MALLRTQIFPSTSQIKEPKTKEWAEKLVRMFDDLIIKISVIPFNRSETLEVSDTGSANTTFTITHHIGRMPIGYIVSFIDKAAIVYCDSTDFGNWSTTEIKLKCNMANVKVNLCVF